jgi:hypothetical protein
MNWSLLELACHAKSLSIPPIPVNSKSFRDHIILCFSQWENQSTEKSSDLLKVTLLLRNQTRSLTLYPLSSAVQYPDLHHGSIIQYVLTAVVIRVTLC